MKIRIKLPVEIDYKMPKHQRYAYSDSLMCAFLRQNRIGRVLARHGIEPIISANYIHCNLSAATSGCTIEEIYFELLLGFKYPMNIMQPR